MKSRIRLIVALLSATRTAAASAASSPEKTESKEYGELIQNLHVPKRCHDNTKAMLEYIKSLHHKKAYALVFAGPPNEDWHPHMRDGSGHPVFPAHPTFWGDGSWNYHVTALVLTTEGWVWSDSYLDEDDLGSTEQTYLENLACFDINHLKENFLTGRNEKMWRKKRKKAEKKRKIAEKI